MNFLSALVLGVSLAFLPVQVESSSPMAVTVEKTLFSPQKDPSLVVIHVRDFDQESATKFALEMKMAQRTGQSVIPVVVSSYGGSVYALLEMIDIVRASRVPVATIAIGKAMSAGAVFLASGTPGYRYAAPNATIMIHEVAAMLMGKNHEIQATAKEVDRLNTMLFQIMAKQAKKPPNYFLNVLKHVVGNGDWYMTAREAKKMGLVDYIKIPTFKIKINVDTVLE